MRTFYLNAIRNCDCERINGVLLSAGRCAALNDDDYSQVVAALRVRLNRTIWSN